ncbi:MAG: hypothetical protein ACNA8W_16870 [Bradymonadaceae bacterium]
MSIFLKMFGFFLFALMFMASSCGFGDPYHDYDPYYCDSYLDCPEGFHTSCPDGVTCERHVTDCGEVLYCVVEDYRNNQCTGSNPSQDCRQTGCTRAGQDCLLDPGGCRASHCECDKGSWTCTEDCLELYTCQLGLQCEGPNPSLDCRDTGCDEDGEECRIDPNGCLSSSCFCDAGSWTCTDDCGELHTCQEVEETQECEGPNPAGCTQDACEDGYVCETDPNTCAPSFCSCYEGTWECTEDCGGGGICVQE